MSKAAKHAPASRPRRFTFIDLHCMTSSPYRLVDGPQVPIWERYRRHRGTCCSPTPPGIFRLLVSYYVYVGICAPIGRRRTRLPVAAKIALQSAGANGGTPGSPTPLDGTSMPFSTMCVFVKVGDSSCRTTG